MPDAARPVTQEAVEHFTEAYVRSLGGSTTRDDGILTITVPEHAETDLPAGETALVLPEDETGRKGEGGSTASDIPDERPTLNPESAFFKRLLADAESHERFGTVSLTVDNTELTLPEWLEQSPLTVSEAAVSPHYDKRATVLLVSVSVETVSEYQTELLRAVAVDTRSENPLPGLASAVLERLEPHSEGQTDDAVNPLAPETARSHVEHALEAAVDEIDTEVAEIQQNASRAANDEVEEYRALQQDRIEELQKRLETLDAAIDDHNEQIDDASTREERLEALRARRDLRTERDEVDDELDDLVTERNRGFPSKRREIRERHDIEVTAHPRTLTVVQYERGELRLSLTDANGQTVSLTVPYSCGVGVTDTVTCERCNRPFGVGRPPSTIAAGALRCPDCADGATHT